MIGGLLKAGGFCTDVQFTEGLVEFGGQFPGCSGYSEEWDKGARPDLGLYLGATWNCHSLSSGTLLI